MGMTIDDRDFKIKTSRLKEDAATRTKKAVHDVATELLRLSQLEVPHDTGQLQNSGHLDPDQPADDIIVGYNKVYAAKTHEHPEYHFQNGRKGKYLEDPLKMNLAIFMNYFKKVITG
jgi:D-Tyr-tRNAtyr deacylase